MLLSLALMILMGMFLGWVCKKLHLPALMGMIVTGIVLGPYVLNLIDPKVLNISAELRKIALIIILTRAGLSLNIADLKKVGRPAVLMCFVPACFEMTGMILLAPRLFGISVIEAAVLGSVIAAVSPAVIVPKMLKLMEEKYGTGESIPQMILAGASVDDVFVIVMFSAFTSLAQGGTVSAASFVTIPVSIAVGVIVGLAVGCLLGLYFQKMHMRDTAKVLIVLCVSFLLSAAEDRFGGMIPFSSLIAIMAIGIALQREGGMLFGKSSEKKAGTVQSKTATEGLAQGRTAAEGIVQSKTATEGLAQGRTAAGGTNQSKTVTEQVSAKLPVAKRLSVKFNKLWVGAEILLFVLVGATVDLSYAMAAGVSAIILIFGVLIFRMIGVFCCMLGTSLTQKERMFCMIAYMPKATVQAAIGGVPLSMGLACGNIVLTVAVLAILITAPLGAFLIELTYRSWLRPERG